MESETLKKLGLAAGGLILAVILFGRERVAGWVEVVWRFFTSGALVALLAVGLVAGCAGVSLGPLGVVAIQSSPAAVAMRRCAMLSDTLTPGVSPRAVVDLAGGALSDAPLALGNTPQGAMRRCARMIDELND